MLIYQDDKALWRQGKDSGGEIALSKWCMQPGSTPIAL